MQTLAKTKQYLVRKINYLQRERTTECKLFFTIKLTLGYTLLSMIFSILIAYPLSKVHLPGRKWLMIFILIPMYFTGGTIPQYLWVKQLGILDTPWSLIWPVLISTYNVIILRNFFASDDYFTDADSNAGESRRH